MTTPNNPSLDGEPTKFPVTQWTSIIEVIQKGDDEVAWKALGDFCESYRRAVYNFFRRRNVSHEDAEEYTQEFFLTRIHKRWDVREGFLFKAHRTHKGKFRCFLSTALRRFLIDKWRESGRMPSEVGDPDSILATLELARDEESVGFEHQLDREVALETIRKAAGRSTHSAYHLAHFRGAMTQAEAAKELRITENAFKQSYARFRESFPHNLREEVKKLVGPEKGEVEAEIKHLMAAFSRQP